MKLERTATGIRLTVGTNIKEIGIPSNAHVAITRQESNWLIWINGIFIDAFSTNYRIPRKPATIGPVDTVLDEIRLTQAAVYTIPFTPPTVPHQAWYQGNPTFTQGQIARSLGPTEGQIAGSKGSIIPSIPTSTSWTGQLYAGQGNRLPPYTGWNPSDIVRLMEALRIPSTEDNLGQVQGRLNQIQALSPQGQKRIQSLLAHRDGLKLELTRTLIPISSMYRIDEDTGKRLRARSSPWKNRHRSRLINKEQKIVEKQIEVATGIPHKDKVLGLN